MADTLPYLKIFCHLLNRDKPGILDIRSNTVRIHIYSAVFTQIDHKSNCELTKTQHISLLRPPMGVYMLQQINRASADLRSILTIHAQIDTGYRYSNVSKCWYLYIIGFQMAPLYVVC